jgi:hypothetical protein
VHHGATRRERRRELVRDEVEREVERRDRSHHSDGNAERVGELAHARRRGVHRDHLAREAARLDRGGGVRRDGPLGLDPGSFQGLTRLAGDRACDLVLTLSEKTCDCVKDLGAPVRRQRLPHRLCGGVDRPPGLVGSGSRHASDDLA